MVAVLHSPCLPDPTLWIALFPKLKIKLKWWCFVTVFDIENQRQSSTAFVRLTSGMLSRSGKCQVMDVYVYTVTILKEMAAKIMQIQIKLFFNSA